MDLFYSEDPRNKEAGSDGKWEEAIVGNYSRWIKKGYRFRRNCKTCDVERTVSHLEQVYLEVLVGDNAFDFETGKPLENERAIFTRPI